jgi:hypothetical protein
MTVFRAIMVLIGSTFAGFVIGGVGGFIMGHLTPTYFRAIWRVGGPFWSPVEMAVEMGTTQGATVGLIAGAVVSLAVYWSNPRSETRDVNRPV